MTKAQDFLPATAEQKLHITRLSMALREDTGIEYRPMTMGEAGRLIREMRQRLTIQARLRKERRV